jgi:hypothetical protein
VERSLIALSHPEFVQQLAGFAAVRWLLDVVTLNTFPGRSPLSGPYVLSPLVTAARPAGCGTSARFGAA